MSGLVTFYKDRLEELDDKEAIKSILKNEKVDETAVFSLIKQCQETSVDSPQDILVFYKKLLTLILILPFSDRDNRSSDLHVKKLLKRGNREGYWSSFQLPMAYAALSSYLTTGEYDKLDVKQLEKGGVLLESGHHIFDGSVIKPIESAHLALIWLYLGWANQDEELLGAALKLAQFCMNFCDNNGTLFQGLWTREEEYLPFELHSALALLFSISSHLRLSSKMNVIKEVLYKKLEEEEVTQVDSMTLLLAINFRKLIDENRPYPEITRGLTLYSMDHSLGFMRYDHQNLSLACTGCGVNTGLGAIHKRGVHIVSFGPHYHPLADSDCFGIYRTSNGSREGFKDLTIESEEDGCQFRGWSRLISPQPSRVSKQNFSCSNPGEQWLFYDIRAEKDNLQLDVRLDNDPHDASVSLAFFVSAEKAMMEGEEPLIPGALERYHGKSSIVSFEKDGEILSIHPQFEGEMQLIPLAGKRHFWSADFLLAFPLTEKLKPYSWKL